MAGYQAVITFGDRVWDSIRDYDRQAMYRVSHYMESDYDSRVRAAALEMQNMLIFGNDVGSITEYLNSQNFELTIKYIP